MTFIVRHDAVRLFVFGAVLYATGSILQLDSHQALTNMISGLARGAIYGGIAGTGLVLGILPSNHLHLRWIIPITTGIIGAVAGAVLEPVIDHCFCRLQ